MTVKKKTFRICLLILTFAFGCKKETPFPPKLPEITTIQASIYENDGYAYVRTGGTIISDGGSPLISCGVCWSTNELPTIQDLTEKPTLDDRFLPLTVVSGSFSCLMRPQTSTTYYIRAFATNIVGTSYGNQVSITTPCFFSMAQIIFGITYPKDGEVVPTPDLTLKWERQFGIVNYGSSYDIYLDNNPDPTTKIASSLTSTNFTITGLSPGTTYYWKVFGWAIAQPCNNLTSRIYHFTTAD
jgi:hypothetical protein